MQVAEEILFLAIFIPPDSELSCLPTLETLTSRVQIQFSTNPPAILLEAITWNVGNFGS